MANKQGANSKKSSSTKSKRSQSTKGSTKTAAKKTASQKEIEYMQRKCRIWDDVTSVLFIAVGIFLFFAVQLQSAGMIGEYLSNTLKGLFGFMALVLPWYLIVLGILVLLKKTAHVGKTFTALAIVIFLMLGNINSGRFINVDMLFYDFPKFYLDGRLLTGGGIIPMTIGTFIVRFLGHIGLYIISVLFIIIPLIFIINTPFSHGMEKILERRRIRKLNARLIKENEQEKKKNEIVRSSISGSREVASEYDKLIEKQRQEKEDFYYNHSDYMGINPVEKKKSNFFKDLFDHDNQEKSNKKVATLSSSSQSKIMKYMNDDRLFDEDNPMPKRGSAQILTLEDVGKEFVEGTKSVNGKNNKDIDSAMGVTITSKDRDNKREKVKDISNSASSNAAPVIESAFDKDEGSSYETPVKKAPEKLSKKEAESAFIDEREIIKADISKYKLPPLNLLNKVEKKRDPNSKLKLADMAQKLEDTLQNFNVKAKVIRVTQGPAITRFEIQPEIGVKVNSIVRLGDDIALNLAAKSIRIEAPIPGKAAVGIEIENDKTEMVPLRDIVSSEEFKAQKSPISFSVGRDISGRSIVADLKSMPHMLIAGSTGSGKSVCVNSIIVSMLYKATPKELKLVLIDPKVVELANYNGIPHLLIPVVTEPSKAAGALNWAVNEMDVRYKKFAEAGARDLATYNRIIEAGGEEPLPQIVIIIDELADLMMAAPSQVEESICRLAQKARAAGMHLIVATQRPSVDIITGLIKANIPSRIAFAVSSQYDSRTILDTYGAEKLVGKGDMLFNPIGAGKPLRVQGTFISDEEVARVIGFIKDQVQETQYNEDVINTISQGKISGSKDSGMDDDADPLLDEAIEFIVEQNSASASLLQRRFRVGYNRAARIIDTLEERGIVGPSEGSKSRKVLMTKEELFSAKELDEGEITTEEPYEY